MGTKKKLIRFEENKRFDHLFEPVATELVSQTHELRGKWSSSYFKNDNELIIELGCGRGEYTTELAKLYPNKNFIGIDIKGSRLNHGAKVIAEKNITNACFIRSHIGFINQIFDKEISGIWITFPDPTMDKVRRRLTSPMFLEKYREILQENATVYLKTDSKELYDYTLSILPETRCEVLTTTDDYYNSEISKNLPEIKTTYEKMFLAEGKKICLIKFRMLP